MSDKTVKLHHDTLSGVATGDVQYKCDAEGNVTVPEGIAQNLVESFGFTLAPTKPDEKPEAKTAKK